VIDVIKSLIKQFMPYAQEKMGFERPPKLFLRQDQQNAANPLGKTGFYDPENESITLYVSARHPKDVLRSLAHELMHHAQKCRGEFENSQNMGEEGYAQTNMHMRSMEIEAYQASIVFRDWEDSQKGTIYYEHLQQGDKSSMSTKKWKNQELKSLLAEAWGFKMDLSKLNESKKEYDLDENAEERVFAPNHYCAHHVVHEGKKAVTVDHNWSEKLQEVTEYDLKFEDGSIKRNVHVTDLDILEGGMHGKRDDDHPPVKKKKEKLEEEDEEAIEEYAMAPKEEEEKPKDPQAEELDEMGCPHDDDEPDHDMMMSGDDEESDLEALGAKAMAAIQALVSAAGGQMSTGDDEMMQSQPVAMSMEESKSKLRKMILQTIKEIQAEKTKGN
tara:strand:- start:1139 stop:2296 length:1158 start_codon:yes stop_codon:yes gene_type:complete